MVKDVATYFSMTLGAFVFRQSMDEVHVRIALHQDQKGKWGVGDAVELGRKSGVGGEKPTRCLRKGSRKRMSEQRIQAFVTYIQISAMCPAVDWFYLWNNK
ncbi:hypothetical protein ACFX2C_019224 [Malus domestica]